MRRWMITCLGILVCTGAMAQTYPASSLLWQIEGPGMTKPSWLFGTFHLICQKDFAVSDTLKHKLQAAARFYGELKMDDPSLQLRLMGKMMLKDTTLSALIPAKERDSVSVVFQRITGFPFSAMNRFKPFLPLSLLMTKAISCAEVIQPESAFVEIAKANGDSIMGLESAEDQLAAVDKIPLDSQIQSLTRSILRFDSVRLEQEALTKVYLQRNIDSLYRYMQSNGLDHDFENALLDERNRTWIPVMEKAMREASCFFAVGAGHLGGSEGVISLLRKKGYTVTPLNF
ncbi:MAG TPA: TraB/GumN family protein [Sediminibacterium sp.]|nr:TraB/GumN family protein [Sediminibacterium sp.]